MTLGRSPSAGLANPWSESVHRIVALVEAQSFQNKSDGPLQRKLMSYISFGVGDVTSQ